VAALAFSIQFVLFRPHGPILALIATAPLVPVIDYLLQGNAYRWNHRDSDRPASQPAHQLKGV
jgi:hypothetical protein